MLAVLFTFRRTDRVLAEALGIISKAESRTAAKRNLLIIIFGGLK
jgi:hypothetical protein